MVDDSSAVPFVEPDGEGCLDVASAAELDLRVGDVFRTARVGCAVSAGIALNLISRPGCDHRRS